MKKLFIFILLLLCSCQIKFKSNINKGLEFPDIIIGDFQYISSDDMGVKEWVINASEAKIYNNRKEVFLYNMSMTFFNNKNQIRSFVSANAGFLNRDTMNVYAEGNVKILSENNSMLEGNRIYWSNDIKKFYTHPGEIVTLKRKNVTVRGYNMVADAELKEVTMESTEGDIESQ